jgi:hypothetical protein
MVDGCLLGVFLLTTKTQRHKGGELRFVVVVFVGIFLGMDGMGLSTDFADWRRFFWVG